MPPDGTRVVEQLRPWYVVSRIQGGEGTTGVLTRHINIDILGMQLLEYIKFHQM